MHHDPGLMIPLWRCPSAVVEWGFRGKWEFWPTRIFGLAWLGEGIPKTKFLMIVIGVFVFQRPYNSRVADISKKSCRMQTAKIQAMRTAAAYPL